MKFASIILAFLTLFSALAPCSDPSSFESSLPQGLELVQQDHDHHDTQGATDHCLPFCSCQCCHSNVTFTHFYVSLKKQLPVITYQAYLFQAPSTPAFPIWQPPRLA